MRRWLILATTHFATLSLGFAAGVYALPILTAPPLPDAAAFASTEAEALYTGRFERRLEGSDFVHWGEGDVKVSRERIAHIGRLSPGPDYKLYLAPRFAGTKDAFLAIKNKSRRIGDVKTFNGFIIGGAAMSLAGPGGLFLYAAALLTVLSALAIVYRCPEHSLAVRATRCPSAPMITGALDAMIQKQDRRRHTTR